MEQKIQIKTSDNHIIYGTLNQKTKSDRLIIFVHGLTGNQNEHQFYNATKFFPKKGYDTFRFDLYSGEDKGRLLSDCDLKIHAKDLNTVISYFKSKYKNLFLVGHSLGSLAILFANSKQTKAVVLWDSALYNNSNEFIYNKQLDKYIIKWGTETLMSKKMLNDWQTPNDKLVKKITKPTKIICAGDGVLKDDWIKLIDKIKVEHELIIIKNAGHCFDEEGAEEKLFRETLSWFEKY